MAVFESSPPLLPLLPTDNDFPSTSSEDAPIKKEDLSEIYRGIYNRVKRLAKNAAPKQRVRGKTFMRRKLMEDGKVVDDAIIILSGDLGYVYSSNVSHYLEVHKDGKNIIHLPGFSEQKLSTVAEYADFYKDKVKHFARPNRKTKRN